MFPILHPIWASAVGNHGLPKIRGYPQSLALGCSTLKSVGHSQESIDIVISSNTPSGLTVDLSAS
jgi:hypothetical protein